MTKWLFILVILLAGPRMPLHSGIAPYTERPTIDFDASYKFLLPYGKWEKHPRYKWHFVPGVQANWMPYRDGRWVYSQTGWLWQGNQPWSWLCEHYGFWVMENGRWSWVPEETWHPGAVLWQETDLMIAWRPVKLNQFGEVTEVLEELRRPETWSVTALTNVVGDLRIVPYLAPAETDMVLRKADVSAHVFKTYREIERPGPDPKKIFGEEMTNATIYKIFTLPRIDSPPPKGATPDSLYLYRPKFAQDSDGILRRIQVNAEPSTNRPSLSEALKNIDLNDKSAVFDKLNRELPVAAPAAVPSPAPAESKPKASTTGNDTRSKK